MTAALMTPADWPEVVALRPRIFVEEQGVPPEIEQDAADATALHAFSRDVSGRVVATGRLLLRDDGTATVGRMATDAAARGQGTARARRSRPRGAAASVAGAGVRDRSACEETRPVRPSA